VVVHDDDPGTPESNRSIYVLLRDIGTVVGWTVGSVMRLYLSR